MKAGLICDQFSKHYCLQNPLLNPCYIHIGLLFVILSVLNGNHALQVLESSNGQDPAEGNVKCPSLD
jgi:hypothetical protein